MHHLLGKLLFDLILELQVYLLLKHEIKYYSLSKMLVITIQVEVQGVILNFHIHQLSFHIMKVDLTDLSYYELKKLSLLDRVS